ncbi:hypothetical protein BDW69DRAFT_5548 [Aspergillus filifer]
MAWRSRMMICILAIEGRYGQADQNAPGEHDCQSLRRRRKKTKDAQQRPDALNKTRKNQSYNPPRLGHPPPVWTLWKPWGTRGLEEQRRSATLDEPGKRGSISFFQI